MKNSPRWNEYDLVRNTAKATKKPSNPMILTDDMENMSSPPLSNPMAPSSISLDDDVSPIHGAHLIRPEGRRKAKAKRKNESKDDESTLYLKSINETLKETVIIEKEKWEAKKKRTEQKALNQEMKVMSQSMVGLTPEQQVYWKIQQSIILERYKGSGFMQEVETSNDFEALE